MWSPKLGIRASRSRNWRIHVYNNVLPAEQIVYTSKLFLPLHSLPSDMLFRQEIGKNFPPQQADVQGSCDFKHLRAM